MYLTNIKLHHGEGHIEADDPVELRFELASQAQARAVRVKQGEKVDVALTFRSLPEEVRQKIREFIG